MSKHAKREGLLRSVKTWLLFSMMLYSIYLAIAYNIHIEITDEFTKLMVFLNLLFRKYLNSSAMVLAAYYFFTKAVKGFIYKLFWRQMMKVLIICGILMNFGIFISFI
jgi:hypothetical protein